MAKRKEQKANEEKWTAPLLNAGWTVIPNVILERQKALGLSAMDLNILLQIVRHWWKADNLPFPSKKTIAECMDVSPSTVQKRISEMEKEGLIKRITRNDPKHGGQSSNYYDLSGLIEIAKPYAEEILKERADRKKEQAARRNRMKPKIKKG